MKTARWCAGVMGAALIACSLAPGQTTAPSATAPDIDPAALEVIQRWIDNPPEGETLRVVVSDSMERLEDTGQKIIYTHQRTVTAHRPNQVRIETRGELENRDMIFDGETVTIFDHDHSVYGQIAVEGSIDDMIDALHAWYSVATPLSDLLRADRAALLEGVEAGTLVGPTIVREHEVDHVAFTGGDIDWQAWIDSGDQPVMRQLAITYKREQGMPQYVLTLEEMEVLDEVDDSAFEFEAPDDATLIRFLEAEEILASVVVAEATETEVTE